MFLSTPFFNFSLDVYLWSVAVTDKILEYFVVCHESFPISRFDYF